MNLCIKQKQTQTQKEFTVTKGKREKGKINQKHGINRNKLLYIKIDYNKDLLYSTGDYAQSCNKLQGK